MARVAMKVKCQECGRIGGSRLPRDGRFPGDGTFLYPRRHKGANGQPCPGNLREALWPKRDGGWE